MQDGCAVTTSQEQTLTSGGRSLPTFLLCYVSFLSASSSCWESPFGDDISYIDAFFPVCGAVASRETRQFEWRA